MVRLLFELCEASGGIQSTPVVLARPPAMRTEQDMAAAPTARRLPLWRIPIGRGKLAMSRMVGTMAGSRRWAYGCWGAAAASNVATDQSPSAQGCSLLRNQNAPASASTAATASDPPKRSKPAQPGGSAARVYET